MIKLHCANIITLFNIINVIIIYYLQKERRKQDYEY